MTRTLPAELHALSAGAAQAFASGEAEAWVRAALADGTLHAAAAAHPQARRGRGRGEVWFIPASEGGGDGEGGAGAWWAVRHYRRGGAVASALGDRFLRGGAPRPWREAAASSEARRRGVPTPAVVAGAIYPRGIFYRADLVTRAVAGATELASKVDAPGADAYFRSGGRIAARLARARIAHPDLNARNIVFEDDDPERAWVLDLDRARALRMDAPPPAGALPRLERSLRKIARLRGEALDPHRMGALRDGWREVWDGD